jgi:hypothetical protein
LSAKQGTRAVPVIFIGMPKQPVKRVRGRKHYNEAVKKLAPVISEVRKGGREGVEAIMRELNARGVPPPGGGSAFTVGSTHRLLRRSKELGVGEAPPSVSMGLKDRWRRSRETRPN